MLVKRKKRIHVIRKENWDVDRTYSDVCRTRKGWDTCTKTAEKDTCDFLRLRLGWGLKRGLREGQVTANVPRSSRKKRLTRSDTCLLLMHRHFLPQKNWAIPLDRFSPLSREKKWNFSCELINNPSNRSNYGSSKLI